MLLKPRSSRPNGLKSQKIIKDLQALPNGILRIPHLKDNSDSMIAIHKDSFV